MLRRAFVGLTALAALAIGTLPVVPGHDIPQHLAYVRLLAMWQRDPASYPPIYAPPDASNGYVTIHLFLACLSAWMSPETALRLTLAAYVVVLALAVRSLVRATWGRDETALLGPLAALNPVLCMGLLAYLVALPPLVAGAAEVVRRRLWAVTLWSAITASLHVVAAAALLFFAGVVALVRRDRRSVLAFALVVPGLAFARGGAAFPPGFRGALFTNIRVHGLIAGGLGSFRVSFTHWLEKLDQIAASVLGPFPLAWKLVAALLLVVMVRQLRTTHTATSGVRAACLALGVAAVVAPAAVQVPDDLSLLDFRLITTATILGIAAIPPDTLAPRRVIAAAALLLLLWARQLRGAAAEVAQTTRLVAQLRPGDRLLALTLHDTSAYLDERNAILHYAPVYHTARSGGVTSLFWARFTPRLPIGYVPSREPRRPPDWAPWELTDEQIVDYTHVLVRWPAAEDDIRLHALEGRLEEYRRRGKLTSLASDGDCSLFAIGP